MNFAIDGIVPIVPTPFDDYEDIAWDELDKLIDFAVSAGASAICLPAYASEFYKLSEQERLELIGRAVRSANGRIPVIAQVNGPALRHAIGGVHRAADAGADAIATTTPRLFPLRDDDLLAYFERLLASAPLPFVIQDFNPGGSTLSAQTIAAIHSRCPNLRYVKLEDAMLAPRVQAVREATGDAVGVLSGWGGMYTLELAGAGIAGIVPGLALTDLLGDVLRLGRNGERVKAERTFEAILPQIVYSLQNLELFHHAEKRLLRARGVLKSVVVRRAALMLTEQEERDIDALNDRILRFLQNS